MKKSLLRALALSLICANSAVYAQDELWYFGGWPSQGAGIYFNGASLVGRNNEAATFFYEATTVVSDGSGNPLFYSTGTNIYDKTHALMTNGSGLMGSVEPGGAEGSGTQGVLAINDPGNPNRYYVITTGSVEQCQSWGGTNNGLHYNIIDMTSGANGAVTSKNQTLIDGTVTPVGEQLAAIAGSCDTTWIIAHGAGNGNFYAFAITSSGVVSTPVVSTVGPVLSSTNWNWARGSMAVSPHGDRLAFTSGFGIHLFDFNINTGVVSNASAIATTVPYYGSEFSPDGQKLYYTQYILGELWQLDICSGVKTLVDNANTYGELVTAANGKIYTIYNGSNSFGSTWLAEIGNPNGNSTNWNFTANAFNTGVGLGLGLPQTYFTPGFKTKASVIVDVTKTLPDTICSDVAPTCTGLFASSVAGSWTSSPSGFVDIHGTFNPGATSNSDTTLVKVYFGLPSCAITDSVSIVVVKCCADIATNAPAAPICPGDSINLSSLVTAGVGTWSIGLTPPPAPGKKVATVAAPWFKSKLNSLSGNYTMVYSLSNPKVGCPDTTQETITVKQAPSNAPVKSASFCAGDSVLISGAAGAYTYSWNPAGETTISKYAKAAGNFVLTTTNIATSCISKDTIAVTLNSLPNVSNIDTSVCAGGTINISVPAYTSYLWDNNTLGQSTNITTSGLHWVKVTNAQNCSDTIFVNVKNGVPLNVSLNNPGTICSGGTATLTASVTGISTAPLIYKWDNVVGASSKVYNTGGTYTVEVTDARNCIGTAQSTFSISNGPSVSLNADTVKCFSEGQTYTATIPNNYSTIMWNGTLSTDTFFTITTAGTITVIVTDNQTCADTADIVLGEKCDPAKVCFPNVITPNGTNDNEKFTYCKTVPPEKMLKMHLVIYDRWGLKMWESTDKVPQWDAKFNGNAVSAGVYYYVAKWTDSTNVESEQTGWIQVVY